MNTSRRIAAATLAVISFSALAQNKGGSTTGTTGGAVTVNQAKVEAGSVTPGDSAGFPLTLSAPGLYQLTGNLVVPDGATSGVVITADNVTLDLNGFEIRGQHVCSGTSPSTYYCLPNNSQTVGVQAGNQALVNVRNGTVRGFGGGIVIGTSSTAQNLDISQVLWGVRANTGSEVVGNKLFMAIHRGIELHYAAARGNSIVQGRYGISASPGSLVERNQIRVGLNGITGDLGGGVAVAGNVVSHTSSHPVLAVVPLEHNLCNGALCQYP